MDDEEDVKKMIELIKSSQEDDTQVFQYDDFISLENSDGEEDEDCVINFDENYDFCNFSSTDISKLNSYDPRSTLKPDERLVIDSCTDPELKNLLLLNRKKNIQLMQLYKKLKDLLIDCQKEVKEKSEALSNLLKANKEQTQITGAWRLAAPYFKDKKLYSCPPNSDTIRKKNNKEISIYDITPIVKWSRMECKKLLGAVKLNYNINQQTDILKKIRNIEKNGDTDNNDELKELRKRKVELENEDPTEIPPLNSDEYIDWLRVSEVFLQDRRTPFECKSFWHIYLHPDINKSPWSQIENKKLKTLVKTYKFQNWDKIAEELGNGRTGFTACLHYYSHVHKRFKKGDFTTEEDNKLIELVHKHRMGNYIPWVKIGQLMKTRTRTQLFHRYTYFLSENDRKKGKFTDAEDILLMIVVDKFGKNFRKCARYLPNRTAIQIKNRYTSNLQQRLKKGSFSLKEDETIMKFVEERGKEPWSKLVNVLNRCPSQIRQRYNTIRDYLHKHPSASLEAVPRRKHNLKEEEDSYYFLRGVADLYKTSPTIPSIQDIERVIANHREQDGDEIKIKPDILDQPTNVDEMLTNFFSNSFQLVPSTSLSSKNVKNAAEDVQSVLNILKVQLDIPDNFDEDKRLDNLDVAILNVLSEKRRRRRTDTDICQLVPPNIHNLVGLRSLLITHSEKKNKNQTVTDVAQQRKMFSSEIKSDIAKQLLYLSEETRQRVKNDRELFYKRFHALFKFPAIMTLVNPSMNLLGTNLFSEERNIVPVKRTYSRTNVTVTVECPEKRLKVPEVPASSTKAVPLKLTPVTNKSVIEDLLLNQNKKLYCMEPVKCGTSTKVVIKEIDFRSGLRVKKPVTQSTVCKSGDVKVKRIEVKNSTGASSKNEENRQSEVGQKLSESVPEDIECITLDSDDEDNCPKAVDRGDTENISCTITADELDNSNDNEEGHDEEDLKKLENFLAQANRDVSNEDEDLKDLKILNIFLKEDHEDT